MNVLALDLSLTSTGYARMRGPEWQVGRLHPPHAVADETRRLAWLRHSLAGLLVPDLAEPHPWDLIVTEDLPPSTKFSGNQNALAAVQAVWRLLLWDASADTTWVNVGHLKMYATGNGNAPKPEVLTSAVRRLAYEGSSLDEADALWLLAMGCAHLGEPMTLVPAQHSRALEKVTWIRARP